MHVDMYVDMHRFLACTMPSEVVVRPTADNDLACSGDKVPLFEAVSQLDVSHA